MKRADLFEILQGTGDAALVVNQSGLITFWNGSAERLLGFSAADALHKSCFALLAGCDASGARVCTADCPVLGGTARDSRVPSFDLHVSTASGVRKWVNVSLIVARLHNEQLLVHLMRDVDARHRLESLTRTILVDVGKLTGLEAEQILQAGQAGPPGVPLTVQETRVLRLLSLGRSTAAIARELKVALATVRNHVHNILHKLHAHTRLEAVMRAARGGLI